MCQNLVSLNNSSVLVPLRDLFLRCCDAVLPSEVVIASAEYPEWGGFMVGVCLQRRETIIPTIFERVLVPQSFVLGIHR